MKISPIILAGGSGSRLWPLSRSMYPKQFLSLTEEKTMIQSTVDRLSELDISDPITVCNDNHRFFVADQLNEINKKGPIILEPCQRNTAPAIAIPAFLSFLRNDDTPMLVMSSDQVVLEKNKFTKSILDALLLAELGNIVTFGILPTHPHTGYGYIKVNKNMGEGYKIDKFIEKPSADKAEEYLNSNKYYWNSGMFLFKPSVFLQELKNYRPLMYKICKEAAEKSIEDRDFIHVDEKIFSCCDSESFDYAIMENTNKGTMVQMDVTWSDVGSWSAAWDIEIKDDNNNVLKGDALCKDTSNTYINSENQLVAAIGLEDIVIIATKDSILVAKKDKSEEVKEIVKILKDNSRAEADYHREVYRPWGKYDSTDFNDGYQVKRITVKPGAKLSVQMHYHRSEHWIVVSGIARVHYGNKHRDLQVNDYTYHDKEVVHALENIGSEMLELIEVQIGDYLGEDDIVRYEDIYGRVE